MKVEVRLHIILSSKNVEIRFTLRTAAKIDTGGVVKRKSKSERRGQILPFVIRNRVVLLSILRANTD